MNNNFNFSQNQMDLLMNLASKKMGTDPGKLKQQMQNGNMDEILAGLAPDQRSQLMGLMNNPQAVQQFIANPKIQQLLQGLMGK